MDERTTSGGLADRLDASSPWAITATLAAGGLALVAADQAFPAVGMGPAYLPLIALAGWRFGLAASCSVAVLAGLLNVYPHHVNELGLEPDVAVARGVVRLSAYAFTIALVHALRGAFDRERVRATHDGLTGALNRAAFDRDVERLLDTNAAGSTPVALAMVDVDDFKRVNDTHGHRAGDHVLRTLATAGALALEGRGRLYRIAGDEFAALVPLASIAAGRSAVERFHDDISTACGRSPYPVTVSVGAVVFQPAPGLDRAALMHEADGHMYMGKSGAKGGVRVVTCHPVSAIPDRVPANAYPQLAG